MKSFLVLCLALTLQSCLSGPITETVLESTKKSPQSDSVPIALLLVVPPTSQFRDEDEVIPDEDFTLIEDHLVNLLLRNVEIPHQDDVRSFQEPLLAEDLVMGNPFLRDDDINVKVVVKEPALLEDAKTISTQIREVDSTILLEPLPSTEENVPKAIVLEDVNVRFVPEETLPSQGTLEDDGISPQRTTSEENPLERSYENEYAIPSKPVENVIATFPKAPESALPILLNCSPKVETGHLAGAAPSYRSHDLVKSDAKKTSFDDESIFKDKSDVLNLNSPASTITLERKRRHLSKTGATHYKVSEDYPETFKGNHHLISADYPLPNMVRIISQDHN